jgi:hypothetical protein
MSSRSVLFVCLLGALALPPAALAQIRPDMVKIGDQMKRTTGTVVQLQNGDRACYMTMRDNRGADFIELASFDFCEWNIIGKRVSLTYRMEQVMAESCQGNPRCMKKDTVPLVVGVKVLR